ncbi:nuclear transport factor 2 family protein [Actinomadura sp. NEAU-AAG5]|uniref:Nuclear transport factor 2 family protein n=1 Tax=Actinomadura litoris TaxID=2678616 RepID=A0A7K1KTA2_9ACTN|nr:nuclear transport factor 2 family protein [Actinomadura litoris]
MTVSDLSRATLLRGLTVAGAAAAIATPAASAEPPKEHPNVTLIRGYYAAYAKNDLRALRERFFAPDVTWTIPGHHPLAGTMKGVDEVLAFFAQLARAGFQAETIFLAADGDWVVDLHRGWSTKPKGLDITWALAFRIERRRIAEAVNYPGDQHAADAYFWKNFPLTNIPQRLHPGERP